MIYMAGENNLTENNSVRYLQNDLKEIIEGSKKLTDNQRIFVFVDSLGTNSKLKGTPYIAEIHGGKVYMRKQYDSEFYSCDPSRFQEVISWMTDNISADGFGLVLWGHASGWLVEPDSIPSSAVASKRAYGYDTNGDSAGGEKWMNITQMAQALKNLPKMDFIFADCCNMMCVEVGYELRNATNYLIGSPAEIPGPGAPYDLIMPYLFKNGSNLYQGIIDTYYDYYIDFYNKETQYGLSGYSVPLSVIDTKYIEQLAQQTKSILSSFTPTYPLTIDLTGVPFYWYAYAPILYDMKAIIKTHIDNNEYNTWEQAFNQAVPYHRNSKMWMSIELDTYDFARFNQDDDVWGNVSMYVPQSYSGYNMGVYKYNLTANNFEWNRMMDWSRFGW